MSHPSVETFKIFMDGFIAGIEDHVPLSKFNIVTDRMGALVNELLDDNRRLTDERDDMLRHLESARAANEALQDQIDHPAQPEDPAPVETAPVVVSDPAAADPDTAAGPVETDPVEDAPAAADPVVDPVTSPVVDDTAPVATIDPVVTDATSVAPQAEPGSSSTVTPTVVDPTSAELAETDGVDPVK